MSTPNIVYLHSHDTGRYVQPYGYAVRTPRIQGLAEEGVLFRQAFCANPTCSPSRAALLTGMWPHCNGMIGLAHRGSRLSDYSQHLAGFLRRNGYHTVLSGVHHEVDNRERHLLGYEEFLDEPVAGGNYLEHHRDFARRAAKFLAGRHDKPFFLSCGFGLTHRTGAGTQWHNDAESPLGDPRYCRPPSPLPDTPETRRDFADYCVAAERLDGCIGTVLDALDAAGLAENTLVICTTDHGIAFPLMKCNLLDHGIGVMLILRGPGGFRGGHVVDAMVSHLDVFPTVTQVTGIPAPDWLQGRSLAPLAADPAAPWRDELFAEVNYHASVEPMRAVRTSRYKYICRYDGRATPVLPNCDDSPSKNELLSYGWAERCVAPEMLFDLVFDPNEACNRVGDAAYRDVLHEMRVRLERWMQETQDPLLAGGLTPWPGMTVNPPDDPSPQGKMVPAQPFLR